MQEGRRAAVATRDRSRAVLLLTAALTLAADQVSKQIVLGVLEPEVRVDVLGRFFGLRLTGNPGGAFGILPSSPFFFFLASVAIVGAVLLWGWRSPESPIPLGLVAGGGLGNLVDRMVRPPGMMRGQVVDFIDFSFWPTFNLADSAIVLGVALLLIAGFRSR